MLTTMSATSASVQVGQFTATLKVSVALLGLISFAVATAVFTTVPLLAPPLQPLLQSDEAFFAANRLLLRNTFTTNFLDGCAFSLPCQAEGELPVGLMLAAPGGHDAALAATALAVEAELARAR